MTKTATAKTLNLLRTVQLYAQPTVTYEDYFKEAGVVWMGAGFRAQFLGLEIGVLESAELAVHRLTKALLDEEIFKELGGRDKAEISISQFVAFLSQNCKSRGWFVFYLRGGDGQLWAVCAYWLANDGGWSVDARSVAHPNGWPESFWVVSCN